MPVSSIGSTPSTAVAQQSATLGQDDLLKILVTQLTYQDPLKPIDNQEFIAQLAQFTSLEQTRQLNEKIESLLVFQSTAQSVGLLGKTVNFIPSAGAGTLSGSVTTIKFSQGVPYLTIQVGSSTPYEGVSLSQVTLVRNNN